ncbi:preprotein translocase subunit SecE [Chitinimonas viridis]|uniref:Protein translocase subunit SecE n=2 Tax=Chitinimonas TaxID=240411 RepID=A0ABT8B4Z7_9NEIS|nr:MULTISPECIES: preprotein translocase subunit SecE [Chitinimonas]MDN3576706.1 preprotein translocase subunit SecE [Chitinimonas viridis]GLR14073.1 protein translocase subunit SecE [Chitinimonas prasina]
MEKVDKLKLFAALALVAAGIAGYYLLPADQQALRVVSVLAGVLFAVTVVWFSVPGRDFVDYARDSVKEAEKVVWPSKKEVWQMTGAVFVFTVVLSLFMWLVDSGLSWLLYDLLLKRGG